MVDGSITNCPMCGCDNGPIGQLGALLQYQCRDCGWVYSAIDDFFEEDSCTSTS